MNRYEPVVIKWWTRPQLYNTTTRVIITYYQTGSDELPVPIELSVQAPSFAKMRYISQIFATYKYICLYYVS